MIARVHDELVDMLAEGILERGFLQAFRVLDKGMGKSFKTLQKASGGL